MSRARGVVWIILLAFEADNPGSNPGGPVNQKNLGRIFFSTNGFKIMRIGQFVYVSRFAIRYLQRTSIFIESLSIFQIPILWESTATS